MKGFTLVELMIVMGIFAIMATLGGVNYFSTINQTNVGTSVDTLVASLRSAQAKAMSGEAVSGVAPSHWGVKLESDGYVIFSGSTYLASAPNNYHIELPSLISLTSTFPNGIVLFGHGTGEVANYNANQDTITLVSGSTSKTIELNLFGVPVGD